MTNACVARTESRSGRCDRDDCAIARNDDEESVRFAGACATDSGIGHEVAATSQVYVYLIERVSQPRGERARKETGQKERTTERGRERERTRTTSAGRR